MRTGAELRCCGRPMREIPPQPWDLAGMRLLHCRSCGHCEPIDEPDEDNDTE